MHRYTKTSTFLFPLLNISRVLFKCNVKNNFGTQVLNNRFINCYMCDSDLEMDFNDNPYLFLVTNPYQDVDYEAFYDTITTFDSYVDEYKKGVFDIMIFKIPERCIKSYNMILEGKYSELRKEVKELIMRHHFYSGKPSDIPLILNKSLYFKNHWEKRCSNPGSPVNLYNQEVWSKILQEYEGLSNEKLLSITKNNRKLIPSKEF